MSVAVPRRTAALPRLGVVVPAFVVSRLLVLAAGIAGPVVLRPFDATAPSLGGRLLAGADRFDAGWYLAIASHGYSRSAPGRAAFLPLYPLLVRAVAVLTRSPALAGVLVSIAAFLVALHLLHRLCARELGPRAADATVLLLCFAPLSLFFSAVYAESLLLALSVGAFWCARTGRLPAACALAALATLTRPTGVVLLAPLVVVWWRDGRRAPELAWLGLVPAAQLGWMVVLSLRGLGLGAELGAEQVVWHRIAAAPPETIVLGLLAAAVGLVRLASGGAVYARTPSGPLSVGAENALLGGVLVVCLVALERCRRILAPEYALYAGLVLVLCLCSRFATEPLDSFDRMALTIFPLWMAAGAWLADRRRLLGLVLAVGAAGLVFATMQFASGAFVA